MRTISLLTLLLSATALAAPASLTVTVKGLPAGQPAEVLVTGPGGYRTTLKANTTLSNLKVGPYQLQPLEVEGTGGAFQPDTAVTTVTVKANTAQRASVAYHRARPGDFNLRFGTGGMVLVPPQQAAENATSALLQPDGKIVVGGWYATNPMLTHSVAPFVMRLNPSSTRDKTFAPAYLASSHPVFGSYVTGLLTTSQGRVFVGVTDMSSPDTSGIARLKPDGQLDTTFGSSGQTNFKFRTPGAGWLLLPAVGGGVALLGGDGGVPGQIRVTAAGQPDGAFGDLGRQPTGASVSGGLASGMIRAARPLPDGRTLVVFYKTYYGDTPVMVDRLLANGQTDPDFTLTALPFTGQVAGTILPNPDGTFLVVGSSGGMPFTARVLPDGGLDQTFGREGIARIALSEGGVITAVARQTDGKLILAGTSGPRWLLARVLPDGRLDSTFGNGGLVIQAHGNMAQLNDVKVLGNGKILGIGTTGDDRNNNQVMLVKVHGR